MLVGKIVEKPSSSSSNPPPPPRAPSSSSAHAFPPVLHRSQRPTASRFGNLQKAGESSKTTFQPPPARQDDLKSLSEGEKVRRMVDDENTQRVAGMTKEEREEEVGELKARFGSGLEDLMRRTREKREGKQPATGPTISAEKGMAVPSRDVEQDENARRVNGMSDEERRTEIKELEERFGAATLDALRTRALKKQASSTLDKQAFRSDSTRLARQTKTHTTSSATESAQDLSQQDLKAKYFPDLPTEPEKMAWFQTPAPTSINDNSPRFDLSGHELSASDSAALPSNIGLHHHGSSPDLAGYTIDEIVHLCQSTVSSQRITMMVVLARIMETYVNGQSSEAVKSIIVEKRVSEQAVNLAVGAILLMSKNVGVFRAGVDLFYESLGGSRWTYMDRHSIATFKPTEDHIDLSAVAWEDIVPTFGEMLDTDSLSPRTTTQMVRILRRLAVFTEEHCELVTPLLPVMVRTQVLLRPWPSTKTSTPPSTEVLALLRDLVQSSRRCAAALVDQNIIEPLLKFPLTLTWDDTPLGQDLAQVSLDILASLARYGLATSIAKSGAEPLDRLRQYLTTNDTPIKAAYFDLIRNWIVCSTDPHKTTPEHDLTWAQVAAMSWIDDALNMLGPLAESKDWKQLAPGLGVVVAWVEGSEVNGVDRGSEEKKAVCEALVQSGVVEAILSDLDAGVEPILAHLVTLHLLIGDFLSESTMNSITQRQSQYTDPLLRYTILLLSLRDGRPTLADQNSAFDLVKAFQSGSEPLVLDLIDLILRAKYPNKQEALSSLPPNGLEILRPLLHYTVLPDLTNVVGPTTPRSDYLKATSTLRPPAPPTSTSRRGPGLPLSSTWLFSPLDELLHSATSMALAQTPPDWDPSELDLVRAVLILAQIHLGSTIDNVTQMTRSELLLNLMKVFMLEHGQQTPTNHSETDLFRDSTISSSMKSLISLTLSPTKATSNLEQACISFLGLETPFFQWYTDFLALYESISFSDHSFTQLLFPPLSMAYPVDYRRLFWSEHTSIIRGIRLEEKDVPLEHTKGLEAFYEPEETDQNVLDGMIRASSRGWLREATFLYGVAVHHLAATLWGDSPEESRKGMMVGVLSTCPDAFVRDIYLYSERISDKGDRRSCVETLAGPRGLQRLEKLGL